MARNNQRGTTTRRAPKDLGRRVKKKPCALCRDRTEWVDYKDVPMLRKYMSDRGDPLTPGHRELRPAPAGAGPSHQDGAGTGPAPVHPAHRDRAPGWARWRA